MSLWHISPSLQTQNYVIHLNIANHADKYFSHVIAKALQETGSLLIMSTSTGLYSNANMQAKNEGKHACSLLSNDQSFTSTWLP